MKPPARASLSATLFLTLGLFSQNLDALPYFSFELELTADWKPDRITSAGFIPTVNSYASAALFDDVTRQRIYRPIILDHAAGDETTGTTIYTAHLSSPNGYMSSRLRDFPADTSHCYVAGVVGHANDYNLHQRRFPDVRDCMPPQPEKPSEVPKDNCPVLLDLDLDGFHLSGPSPAVSFDIDADGSLDQIAWTRAGDDDAFLCLDRNRNGAIDDGSELFGYATPMLSGQPARIGYRALAELDWPELGGNEDGKVDARDVMFRSLCVWNDRNRDGASQASEIQSAESAGVVSLGYVFHETRLRDSFGNWFWYVSRGEFRTRLGRVRPWLTYDVIFAEGEP